MWEKELSLKFRHFDIEFHVSAVDSPRDERTDDGKE